MTVEKQKIEHSPIVLYDGDCTMCNTAVQFILRHEKNTKLKFSSLEKHHNTSHHLKTSTKELPDAIHLLLPDRVLIESDAIIGISKYLKWPYSLIRYIKIIPKCIRDSAYRMIAKRRKSMQPMFKSSCDLYENYSDRMI